LILSVVVNLVEGVVNSLLKTGNVFMIDVGQAFLLDKTPKPFNKV